MAARVGRKDPFSGETIRQYEEGVIQPGKVARRALALVFEVSEQYIEFGGRSELGPAVDPMLDQLVMFYRQLSDDSKHTLLGYANKLYIGEHPGPSAANPFSEPTPTKPKPGTPSTKPRR